MFKNFLVSKLGLIKNYNLIKNNKLNIRNVIKLPFEKPYFSGAEIKEAELTIKDIINSQIKSVRNVVPWFLKNMPVRIYIYILVFINIYIY